jgi:hypothetical protein
MTQQSSANKKSSVNLVDLHIFHRALTAAHNYFEMDDMRLALRNLEQTFEPSALTVELREAKERIAGVVAEAMAKEYLDEDLSYDKHEGIEEGLDRFEDDGGPSE